MPDSTRRESLLARSKVLRDRATAFKERLKDERAKDVMRTMVFNWLDDVDGFFLGHPDTRPSEPIWEGMWLDNAERILTIAEDGFNRFEEQVKRYGGPENVRIVG
jgi:hypothetical protein